MTEQEYIKAVIERHMADKDRVLETVLNSPPDETLPQAATRKKLRRTVELMPAEDAQAEDTPRRSRRWWPEALAGVVAAAALAALFMLPLHPGPNGPAADTKSTTASESATTAVPVTTAVPTRPEWLAYLPEEVEGYEAYKADAIEKSGIADTYENFCDNTNTIWGIHTYAAYTGNFTGGGEETLVLFWVLREKYGYPLIFLLLSESGAQYYAPDLEEIYGIYPKDSIVDIDGDGYDEMVMMSGTGGSGGCLFINVVKFTGDTARVYPLNDTCFRGELGDRGEYTIINTAAGFQKTYTHENAMEVFPHAYDQDGRYLLGDERDMWIDWNTAYEITDADGDVVMEIVKQHTLWAFCHPETFGYGFEILKYNPISQEFEVIRAAYIPAEEYQPNYLNGDEHGSIQNLWPE